MLTLAQFVDKWNGRFCDYDHYYGAQCFDLANQFAAEVLNEPPLRGAGAIDIWLTAPADYARVANAPTNTPPAGAVVIWEQNSIAGTGVYGHVAVACETQGVATFTAFSQNWPTGSPCHLQRFTYDGVVGWLVHRSVHPAQEPTPSAGHAPVNGHDAVDTLRRHAASLTDHYSLDALNDLLHKVAGWPHYTS